MGIPGRLRRGWLQSLCIFLLVFLISFWTAANTVHAQRTTKKNFLWAVQTGKATIYLLGSIHLLKSDSYPLDKNIEAAYRNSKKVVFETDIGGMNTSAVREKMTVLALYPEGQTLQKNVSLKTYRMLEKKVVEAGLSMDQLNRLRPWMCALTLVLLKLQKMGFDPNYGIDQYFFNKARQDKKEMVFLESIDYQIDLFGEMNTQEEESFLQQMLKDLEVVETMFADIVRAWETGDAARLGSILTISFKDHQDIYNRFLTQRNRAWIKKIEGLMAYGENALVIVGAGHLVGPDNVLQLLEDKGYTVKQVLAHAGGAAISSENLTHALYIRSGMNEQIRSLPVAIQIGFDQVRDKDDRIQQIPEDFYANIKELLAESFAADKLNALVLRHMEAQMSQAEMQTILNWLNSPVGKRCTQLFKASLTPTEPAKLQEFMNTMQQSPPPPTRLKLIQELASATQTTAIVLEIAVNTQLVVTTVITATLPVVQQRPFSEILDEADTNRPLLEPRVDQQLQPLLLYMYRSVSDTELEQYIAFATSSAGAQYYRSMLNGIKLALMDSSVRFGASMAQLAWKRRQGEGTP